MPAKQQPRILSTSPLEGSKGKFVELQAIEYQDEDGKKRHWEMACRKTRGSGGVDAVAIFTLLHSSSRPLSTVIIEQYRPPIDAIVVELPAGLIDEGEDAETSALRELREETGYGVEGEKEAGFASVREVSPVIVSDPGMTNANLKIVTVDVKLPDGDLKPPKAQLEEGEHIVQRVVEVSKLYDILKEYDQKPGFAVDARLANLAYGLHLGTSLISKTSSSSKLNDDVAEEESKETCTSASDEVGINAKDAVVGEEMVAPIS